MSSEEFSLRVAVYNAFAGIIDTIKSPFQGLTSLFVRSEGDKERIERFRQSAYQDIEGAKSVKDFDYSTLTKKFTKDTKQFLNKIINEEIAHLGKPPVKFVIVPSGSMAREEVGPITDFEMAILMEEDSVEAQKYFRELSQRISDRLFLLGEHPDIGGKGLRLDEADNAPIHMKFFARNVNAKNARVLMKEAISNRDWDKIPYEGSRPYLTTVDNFVNFSKGKFPNENLSKVERQKKKKSLFDSAFKKSLRKSPCKKGSKAYVALKNEIEYYVDEIMRPYSVREQQIATGAGRTLGRNLSPIYGDLSLFDKFKSNREALLSQETDGLTGRQHIAFEAMQEDIAKALGKQSSLMLKGELGDKVDIKRDLYRFAEQLVTNLGFYYNVPHQNTSDILKYLMSNKILHPRFGLKLLDYINFATKLRLQQQSILGRQGFATYLNAEAFEEDKGDVEKTIAGLKAQIEYYTEMGDEESSQKLSRELQKAESKYEHLLDMAPGKVLSAEDERLLKQKYAPMLKEIFSAARKWTSIVADSAKKASPDKEEIPHQVQKPVVEQYKLARKRKNKADKLKRNEHRMKNRKPRQQRATKR